MSRVRSAAVPYPSHDKRKTDPRRRVEANSPMPRLRRQRLPTYEDGSRARPPSLAIGGLIPPSTSTGSPQSSIDRPRKRLGFAKPIEESDHYCCDDRMNLRKLYRTRRVGC